jgi:hypothetical protein
MEFLEDRAQIIFHRLVAEPEFLGDFLVRHAFGDQGEDALFLR